MVLLRVHDFEEQLLDSKVYFHVIHMVGSVFVWVGGVPASMAHLSVATPVPNVRHCSSS